MSGTMIRHCMCKSVAQSGCQVSGSCGSQAVQQFATPRDGARGPTCPEVMTLEPIGQYGYRCERQYVSDDDWTGSQMPTVTLSNIC